MIKNKNRLYAVLLAVTFITACLPVFCGYILTGGMAEQWVVMLRELSQAKFSLYVDLGTASGNGFSQLALSSDLFYFIPAMLLRWSGNVQQIWVMFLFLIQVCSLGGAALLYRYVSPGRTGSLCGILLYMTMPFRIYLCYDRADISQALVWMLLPFYLWSVLHVINGGKRYLFVPVSIAILAATAYANAALFPIIAGLTLLAGLIARNIFLPVTALGGTLLAMPGMERYIKFLFDGNVGGVLSVSYDISFDSIMTRGYAVGELFSFFKYAQDKPGMGVGLLFVLFLLVWGKFVHNRSVLQRKDIFYLAAGLLLILCSLRHFPWDLVQRVHPALLKMVACFWTPGVFAHFGCFLLTLPCAGIMESLYRDKERDTGVFLAAVLYIMCIAMTFYQCNTYVFSRLPLSL